jgi:hypothetical protein
MKILPYNRLAAVEYARAWAFARNPKYFDFSNLGGDCTNFISQCVAAGGMPMNVGDLGWYYQTAGKRSASFSGVQFLCNFLTQTRERRGPFAVETDTAHAEIGDIIQLSFDGRTYGHSLLIVQGGIDPLISTHSNDAFARPLSSYNFAAARALHIVGGYA